MNTAETRIRLNTDMIFHLLESVSRDAILFIRKSDGMIVWANNSSARMYGYPVDELLSMYVEELRAVDRRETVFADMDHAFDGGHLFETIHQCKDGTLIPVEVNSSGASYGQDDVLVSIVRDLRERKDVQRELIRTVDRKCRSAGRKLHEGLSQTLSGILFLIRSLGSAVVKDHTDLESQFEAIEVKIREVIVESKNLAHYLTLVEHGEKGLVVGLQSLAESIERIHSPRCEVSCNDSVLINSDEIAQHLYYVAQESTKILLSHGPGDLIEINLMLKDPMVVKIDFFNWFLNEKINF